MPTPDLDLRRLERDLVAEGATRPAGLAPGGRAATGLMAVVRDNLDALVALQVGGQTWNAIAAGLTKQGYTTADGRALTGGQLTGLISSVRRQAARRAAKVATRERRGDLLPAQPRREAGHRLTLSTDLAPTAPRELADPDGTSEEAIRRENLANLQGLLKPPSKKD